MLFVHVGEGLLRTEKQGRFNSFAADALTRQQFLVYK